MERWLFTLLTCILSIPTLAQIQVPDTSNYDTILHKTPMLGVEHVVGVQKDAEAMDGMGSLVVFIQNSEEDDIIGATVRVMDGERQVTGGVTDFGGFLYLPDIQAGTYEVRIRHISVGERLFTVEIQAGERTDLKTELEATSSCLGTIVIESRCIVFHNTFPKPTDSIQVTLPSNKPRSANQAKGGLKVFITNAELDDIIGATVQVMDGERQVTGGVADFTGFLYLPNIEAGTYTVKIRHITVGEKSYEVNIKPWGITNLRKKLESTQTLTHCPCCGYSVYQEMDPFVTSYTSQEILRTP